MARRADPTLPPFRAQRALLVPDGRTSFQALQNASSGGGRSHLACFVFDLLSLSTSRSATR